MLITSARVQKALAISNTEFKRLFGIKRQTFAHMLAILQDAFEKQHRRGGKPPTKLRVEDKLLLALQYWREYRTMEHLAFDYNTVKSYVHKSIEWVENTLIRSGAFRLPGKKVLLADGQTSKTLAVDVTESPIERPKKNRRDTIPAGKSVTL